MTGQHRPILIKLTGIRWKVAKRSQEGQQGSTSTFSMNLFWRALASLANSSQTAEQDIRIESQALSPLRTGDQKIGKDDKRNASTDLKSDRLSNKTVKPK